MAFDYTIRRAYKRMGREAGKAASTIADLVSDLQKSVKLFRDKLL